MTLRKCQFTILDGSQTLPPPLDAKEEEEILQKLANGDESVRKILKLKYTKFYILIINLLTTRKFYHIID